MIRSLDLQNGQVIASLRHFRDLLPQLGPRGSGARVGQLRQLYGRLQQAAQTEAQRFSADLRGLAREVGTEACYFVGTCWYWRLFSLCYPILRVLVREDPLNKKDVLVSSTFVVIIMMQSVSGLQQQTYCALRTITHTVLLLASTLCIISSTMHIYIVIQ